MASVFRLHGIQKSTCTRRVAIIAKERNIPYELVPINFAVAEHKQPAHLEHQPFGQVPYITVRLFSLSLSLSAPSMAVCVVSDVRCFSGVELARRL